MLSILLALLIFTLINIVLICSFAFLCNFFHYDDSNLKVVIASFFAMPTVPNPFFLLPGHMVAQSKCDLVINLFSVNWELKWFVPCWSHLLKRNTAWFKSFLSPSPELEHRVHKDDNVLGVMEKWEEKYLNDGLEQSHSTNLRLLTLRLLHKRNKLISLMKALLIWTLLSKAI